ncbi:MAG TPA: TSUP family transporter [Mycobacterium sp.]|nr:TSUP family transporter [Mycobacterium sp.]
MFALVVLFVVALAAGALAGIVGTGSSLLLLPLLVMRYGPRVAVPVMGIAAVMANVARIAAWWRQIQWRPVLAYSLPGTPAAVLGAPVFTGYGLGGGAFLGTEAASSLVLYAGKMATFGQFGVLNQMVLLRGFAIGTALMIGPFLARSLVDRVRPHTYALLIDLVPVAAAAGVFIAAWAH